MIKEMFKTKVIKILRVLEFLQNIGINYQQSLFRKKHKPVDEGRQRTPHQTLENRTVKFRCSGRAGKHMCPARLLFLRLSPNGNMRLDSAEAAQV